MAGRRGLWPVLGILAAGSAAGQEPWGTVRTTAHEAGAPDAAGNVPLRWKGEVVAPRAASDSARVVLILRDEAGAEVYACASGPVGPTAGGPQSAEIQCLIPGTLWPHVYSLGPAVVGTAQPLAERPKPEPPPVAVPVPQRREGDLRLAALQREAEEASDRYMAEDRNVAALQDDYNQDSEDYIDQCSGDAAKVDSARCQRMRDQLDRLRKEMDRAEDRRERARRNYERAAERLREAQGRMGSAP